MAKRRTSGIQRRSRASEAAMTRRLGTGEGVRAIDARLLIVGGVLVVGLIILVVVLLFGGGNATPVGTRQPDQGGGHLDDGTAGGPYNSVPATSGQHWDTPAQWGVYTEDAPAIESQVIHNLEHGGIVIWYQPDQLTQADIDALVAYADQQVRAAKFKVILSPWFGTDFEHPIAVTSWNWLLYLDTADIDQIRAFLDQHYQQAPENLGGPAQPAF